MKKNAASGAGETPLARRETETRPVPQTDWAGLAWLTVLVALGLAGFEKLEHVLFPGLSSLQHQAITVCLGTIAAVVGTYTLTRRLDRALERQQQAETKLALDRNVLRTVTDNIPDSIFAKDTEGRYLLANKAFAALHGVKSPDELLGKSVFDLFPKERASVLHADDLQVMRSGGSQLETERTAVDQDGKLKVLLTTKVPLIDQTDKVIGIVGVHRDITRRKEAEHRLQQSEANLAAAQRIAHFGSIELDLVDRNTPEKNPVRWSEEVFRIFGYPLGVTEPSRAAFFRIVHPADTDEVRRVLDEALREAKPYDIDFRIIRPDGTERHIHERGDIIVDPKTRMPLKLVGSIQDVTDQARAEMQVQEANRELGLKVRELEQRTREIRLLSEMGQKLQSCNEDREAYQEISFAAEQLFEGWSGAVCVTSASRTAVERVFGWGDILGGTQVFAPDECWALRRGKLQSYRAGEKVAPCRHLDLDKVSESLCVPLVALNETIGILSLQRVRGAQLAKDALKTSIESERRLATVFAEQVAMALGNLTLRASLKNQSICDPLTGLFNRRYMEESLEREFGRAKRNKTAIAIIMMDMDHFKRFNDTFGHQGGDALLRSLGDLLKRTTRGQDIACRYGGEEFALVLTDSSLQGALQRCEHLRQEVKQLSVEYAGQLLGAVTISMGVALYPDHGTNSSDVMRAADQALYHAKREGRDRISIWTAEAVV